MTPMMISITTCKNGQCLNLLTISVSSVKIVISGVKRIVSEPNKKNKSLNLKNSFVASVLVQTLLEVKKAAKYMVLNLLSLNVDIVVASLNGFVGGQLTSAKVVISVNAKEIM